MPMLEKMGYDTICEGCQRPREWSDMLDNDLCADCNQPSPKEFARMKSLYEAEKRAGLLPSQEEETRQNIRDAGRGHQLR